MKIKVLKRIAAGLFWERKRRRLMPRHAPWCGGAGASPRAAAR